MEVVSINQIFLVNNAFLSFKFSETIGVILGKGLRYLILGGLIVLIHGKFNGSTLNPKEAVPSEVNPPASSP
jgi:hypothetical protein